MAAIHRICMLALLVICMIALCSSKSKRSHGIKHKDTESCTRPRHFRGCIASVGKCKCLRTKACTNPFPYRSKNECKADVKGINDKCRNEPCVHGACVQTKLGTSRSWYCECAGTGYHGHRCQTLCPQHTDPLPHDYPPACAMLEDDEGY